MSNFPLNLNVLGDYREREDLEFAFDDCISAFSARPGTQEAPFWRWRKILGILSTHCFYLYMIINYYGLKFTHRFYNFSIKTWLLYIFGLQDETDVKCEMDLLGLWFYFWHKGLRYAHSVWYFISLILICWWFWVQDFGRYEMEFHFRSRNFSGHDGWYLSLS